MNQRQARQRQQLIENTLAGLKALMEDQTLLAELDPGQEVKLKLLMGLAAHKGYIQL